MDASVAAPQGLQGLRPPPREVPLQVKLDELFGGPLSACGWIFLGVGLLFVSIFAMQADFNAWRFHGALESAAGRSTRCYATNTKVNGRRVYATDFFFHQGEQALVATSYGRDCYQAGRDVPVEFPAGRPDLARVKGLDRSEVPAFAAFFVLIFPVVGFSLVFVSLRTGLRDIRLLERGVVARGTVVGKRATNMKIDNRMVWELDVSFKDAFGKSALFKTRTCFPEKVEGEGVHSVFYDPDRPEDAISVDALPEPLFADLSGGLRSDGWGRALGATVLPALVIGCHGAYWLWRLTR